jgi:ABC-type branched-subunit amino acid transport system substrate-binding protein
MKRCLILVLIFTACSSGKPTTGPTIPIGDVLPFTGNLTANGTNIERGLLMVINDVNQAGGISGVPLQLYSRDTHSDARRGLEAVHELIESVGAVALLGPEEGELASLMAPLLDEDRVVGISGGATLPNRSDSSQYSFRTAPSNLALASVLAKRMFQDDVRRPVILNVSDPYGEAFASALGDQFKRAGGMTFTKIAIDPAATVFDQVVRDSVAANPDAIVLVTYPSAGAGIVEQFSALASGVRWYFAPSLRSDVFLENVTSGALEGMIGVSAALASDADTFAGTFSNRWAGDLPLEETYFYYDAMALVALATQSAAARGGPLLTGTTIRDQLHPVSSTLEGHSVPWYDLPHGLELLRSGEPIYYRGASGAVALDVNGDVAFGYAQVWVIQNDHIVNEELLLAMPL